MEAKLLQALKAHYEAELQKNEANLLVYFKNPGGIGEHPDVVSEMVKLLDGAANARGALAVLESMVHTPANEATTEPQK